VVDYTLDQREFILAYTRVVSTCAAPLFTDVGVIVNNDASASSAQYDNRGPVVCYSGDFIQVAWEFTNNPTFPLGNTFERDILLRRLTWGGVLAGLNIYSRVNFSTIPSIPDFNQAIPSIAGRYAVNGTGVSVCHFMFVDDNPSVQQVRYKIGAWSAINLRPVKNESQTDYQKSIYPIEKIDLYPNPSNGEIFCSGCSDGSLVVVYDATGRESMRQQVLNAQAPLRLDELANGLYRIEVVQVNGDIYRTNLIKE
jgi:hypothetical protein